MFTLDSDNLGIPYRNKEREDYMSHKRTHQIKWTCRILAILYTAFFGLFALGALGQGYTLQRTLIELLPALLLIVATIVAWYRPALGGVWFVFHGLVSMFFFNMHTDLITLMLISLLALIIGGLLLWVDLVYDDQTSQNAIG